MKPHSFPLPVAILTAFFILHPSSFILAQGSLAPPGAPAPTMCTLDQLETRTPISSLPFSITVPGSYYLAGHLTVSSGNGITINSDNVTLDLNGFTLASTASPAAGVAVNITGTPLNVIVRNGHIRGTTTFAAGTFTTGGFLDGIRSVSGTSANLRIAEVSVSGVGGDAIDLALTLVPSSVIESCTVSICAGIGIRAGVVRDCTVETAGGGAILADLALHSSGESVGPTVNDHGVSGTYVVKNCRGVAAAGTGVKGAQVSNSRGTSATGPGLAGTQVQNCEGTSTSGLGLSAAIALNCLGVSTTGATGLTALGTAANCRGRRDGGTALNATIAIGCTVLGTGVATAPEKHLGTP